MDDAISLKSKMSIATGMTGDGNESVALGISGSGKAALNELLHIATLENKTKSKTQNRSKNTGGGTKSTGKAALQHLLQKAKVSNPSSSPSKKIIAPTKRSTKRKSGSSSKNNLRNLKSVKRQKTNESKTEIPNEGNGGDFNNDCDEVHGNSDGDSDGHGADSHERHSTSSFPEEGSVHTVQSTSTSGRSFDMPASIGGGKAALQDL